MPATSIPVAAYAASVMCNVSATVARFHNAASGSMFVAVEPLRMNPEGVFIQALTETTRIPDSAPLAATITPASQCARGGTRSQP